MTYGWTGVPSLRIKLRRSGSAPAAVRDLRELATEDETADFETDVMPGLMLARSPAGWVDSTMRKDVNYLDLIQDWFGRPRWEIQPADADTSFGKVLCDAKPPTQGGHTAALTAHFRFLEPRHSVELHNPTGRVVECPLDETESRNIGAISPGSAPSICIDPSSPRSFSEPSVGSVNQHGAASVSMSAGVDGAWSTRLAVAALLRRCHRLELSVCTPRGFVRALSSCISS
ncbi:hypothetical protein [Nocardia sp. NPDC059239]|uniref:hypothetical protein n=1 Tax=Nocardia sp. NPDC059239 TaxID=3346785 RepID=UPI0036B0854D